MLLYMKAYVVVRVSLHIIFVYGAFFEAGAVKHSIFVTFAYIFPSHGRTFDALMEEVERKRNPAEPNSPIS